MLGVIIIVNKLVVKGAPVLVTSVAGGLARKSVVSGPTLTVDHPSGGRSL